MAIIFALYQLVAILTFHAIFYEKQLVPTDSHALLHSKIVLIPILGSSYAFIHRVCFQPVVLCFSYLLLMLFSDTSTFKDYKQIPDGIVNPRSWQHICMFVLISICLLENILTCLCRMFFFTDTSLMRISIWGSTLWQGPLLELTLKFYLSAAFVMDSHDSAISATSFVGCFVFIILIILRFYKTLSSYVWADLAELFYECIGFLLYIFILIGQVF